MNTKGMKFLAVLAVLAMTFASVAIFTAEDFDAATEQEFAVTGYTGDIKLIGESQMSIESGDTIKVTITPGSSYKMFGSVVVYVSEKSVPTTGYMTILEYTNDYAYAVAEDNASSTLTINTTGAAKADGMYLYVYQGVIDSTWTVKENLPDADETGIINLENKTAYTVTLTDNFETKVLLSGSDSAALNFVGESEVETTNFATSFEGLIQNVGSGQLIISGYGKISATSTQAAAPVISNTGDGLTKICGTQITFNNSPVVYGNGMEVHDGTKLCSTREVKNARTVQLGNVIGGEFSATSTNATNAITTSVIGSMDSFEIPVYKLAGSSAEASGSTFVKLKTDNLSIYNVAQASNKLETIVYDGTGATSLRTDAGLIEIFNGNNDLAFDESVEDIASTIILNAGSLTVGTVAVSGSIEMATGTTFTGGNVAVTGTLVSKGTGTVTSLTLGPEAVVGGIDVTALTLPAGTTFVAGGMAAVASTESVITYVSDSNTLTLTRGSLSISAYDGSEDGVLNVSVIDGDVAFNGITVSLKGTAGEEASYALVLSYTAETGAATTEISDVAEDIEINASNGKAFNLAGITFTSNKVDSVLAVDIVTDNENSESYEVKSGKFTLASTSLENTDLIVDNGATVAVGTAEYSVASGDSMTLTLSSTETIAAVMKEGSMSVSIPKNGTFEYDDMTFTAKNKAATVQVLAVEQEEPAWDVVAYSGELNFTTETNGDYLVAITENSALTVGDSAIEYTNTTVSINFDGTKYTVSPAGEDPIDVVYVYEGGDAEVAIPDTLPIAITAVAGEEVNLPFTLSYTKALVDQDVVYEDITIVSGIANVAYDAADTEVSADADAIIQIGTAPTTKEYLAAGAGATFVLTEDGLDLVNGSIMINENVGAQLDTYGGTTITIEQNDSIIIVMAVTPEPTEEVPAPETSYIFAVAQGKVSFANVNGYDAVACGGIVSAPGFDIAADDEESSVAVNVSADGKVTIVSGDAVIDLTALEYTIDITEGVTAISGDNHIYAEADSTLVFTKNGEDVMIAVGSGKVQATVESGFQISLNNLVYTVADDAVFTVDLTVDGVKAVDLVSGTLDVYGTMTTADSLTVTGGSVQITKTLTIADGVDYTVNSTIVYADENSKIVLQKGAQVNATISAVNASGITASVTVQGLIAGTAGVEIYPGSVIITGTVASNGTITANTLDVVLKDLIIPNGVTLTVADEASVVLDNVEIQEGGELIIGGTASGDVVNNGTLTINKDADIGDLDIEGTGEIVDKRKNTMEDQEVSGDATKSHVYPSNQRIIVRGSWTILKGADVTIKGELVIPDGAKLTVENGATLSVTKANAEISGTLVIDAGDDKTIDGMFTCERGNVNVYGTVLSNGFFIVNGSSQGGNVTIYEGASFTVGAEGQINVNEGGDVTVKSGAELTIKGASAASSIYNYGTVVFDTLIPADGPSMVYQMANNAVVDIKNYSVGYALGDQATLTISDSRLVFYTDKSDRDNYLYYVVADGSYLTGGTPYVKSKANTLVIASSAVKADEISTISGLKATQKVTSVEYDGDGNVNGRQYTNTMDLAGDLKKSSAKVEGATGSTSTYTFNLTLTALKDSVISGTLKMPVGFTFYNLGTDSEEGLLMESVLRVSGEFDASASSSSAKAIIYNTDGTITIQGSGIMKSSRDITEGTIHAAKTVIDGSSKVYQYMTVDSMIAAVNADGSKIKEFEVIGTENYVTKTASIPGDVKVTVKGTLHIGATVSDIEITLTIKNGADFKGEGTTEVWGTLYAEDATNVKSNTEIVSDIKMNQVDEKGKIIKNGWVKWTNLTLALSSAVAGDEITITKETGYVWLHSSAEVKEGVTLYVDDEAVPLIIANGATLTVNGLFVSELPIYAQSMFDLIAKNDNGTTAGDRSSAIVVNGALMMNGTAKYDYIKHTPNTKTDGTGIAALTDGAPIAGAYLGTDDYPSVIAGIDTAFEGLEDIITSITVYGVVSADALEFEATETCSKIIVGANNATYPTKFSFVSLTLDGAEIDGASNGTVKGVVSVGDASIYMDGVSGAFKAVDKEGKLVLSGAYSVPKDATLSIYGGTVYASTLSNDLTVTVNNPKEVSVAAGATLVANGSSATFAQLDVYGTLSVPSNKAMKINNLTVYGNVNVAAATSTASSGNLNVQKMYVGMDKADLGAVASVSGPFAFEHYVLAYDGSTFDIAAMAVLLSNTVEQTVFFVEGDEWFTAYVQSAVASAQKINVKAAPIEDAELKEWNTKADMSGTSVSMTGIQIGQYPELYAKINYDIYRVEIKSDAGIKEISLNGKLMKSPASGTNVFYLNDLRAGTYKVSYTLINGYEGTATLKTSEGTILQNNSFVLTGMDADQLSGGYYVFEYQLNGTEPVPEPEPVTPEEQSEWTITTILLCVLVVLIAIMAVIVALRLNRN